MSRVAAAPLPWPLREPVDRAVAGFLQPDGGRKVDFAAPAGEPALVAPESVSWAVFKNPVAVFIGGVTAVLLELAEPRVRAGVWEHTSFRTDPLARLRRTGLAAMITIYGARSLAEAMIGRVNAMHARIAGVADTGERYRASDRELLVWVQTTAAFGFAEAYARWVRPLTPSERDLLLTEGRTAARLYGARGAPASMGEQEALFAAMRKRLRPSPVVLEFLEIMRATPVLPGPARGLQSGLVKAAVATLPDWAREILELGARWTPGAAEAALVRLAAGAAERIVVESSPAAQSCRRLGLPAGWLWRR